MENKSNPFELFDGEWFKDATKQLCADGWPTFIVPLNIGIRKIRESHQELEKALESANAEVTALKKELSYYKDNSPEDYLTSYENELLGENKKLSEQLESANAEFERYKVDMAALYRDETGKCYNTISDLKSENKKLSEANTQLAEENAKLFDEIEELAWYKEQWQSIAGKASDKNLRENL